MQKPINDFFVSIGRRVRKKSIDLGGRWRQTRKIERHAANERLPRGLARWRQLLRFQSREDETIDGVARPRFLLYRRRPDASRRNERPVRFVLRPLLDPPSKRFFLRRSDRLVRLGRRHLHVFVGGVDPPPHFRLAWLPGHDRSHADTLRRRSLERIQPPPALTILRIEAVAIKTVVCQDRPNVAIEQHSCLVRPQHRRQKGDGQGNCSGLSIHAWYFLVGGNVTWATVLTLQSVSKSR